MGFPLVKLFRMRLDGGWSYILFESRLAVHRIEGNLGPNSNFEFLRFIHAYFNILQ